MDREKLEFLISQHLDGDLAPEQQAELREQLQADPQARALLEQHQRLHGAFLGLRGDVPQVGDDELFAAISDHLDADSGRSFKLPAALKWMSAAAVVAMGVVGGVMLMRPGSPAPQPPGHVPAVASVVVVGPAAETGSGRPILSVSLGEPDLSFDATAALFASEALDHHGSVLISRGMSAGGAFD